MKKIVLFSFFISSLIQPMRLFGDELEHKKSWFTAITAGYVFKHDCAFKNVYGHGIVNVITADGCYYPWKHWGVGAKVSYWRAKGRTTFLRQRTLLQEMPFVIYLRGRKEFQCRLQLYGSLGGGIAWIKEKSYLPTERLHKGIGEVEIGINYPLWRCINIAGALRYLFPPQKQLCETIDIGGVDVRAGIGFSF